MIDPKEHENMLRALGWKPPEPVKWPEGMFLSHDEARTVASGLLPDGVDVDKLTPKAKQEIRAAIDVILKTPRED